jgi:transposase
VRIVFEHRRDHPSRWAAVVPIAEGVPTDVAEKMMTLVHENRELRQANEIQRKASA